MTEPEEQQELDRLSVEMMRHKATYEASVRAWRQLKDRMTLRQIEARRQARKLGVSSEIPTVQEEPEAVRGSDVGH